MKKKRLNRDEGWGFQCFPYHQMRMDHNLFHGFISVIELTDGQYCYWEMPRAGKVPVCGKGMTWLQMIPDGKKRLITAMFLPDKKAFPGRKKPGRVSAWYVDVMNHWGMDPDGIAYYVDQYLDVIFTPQGDVHVDDRDELDAAYEGGELTKEQYESALQECVAIIGDLCADVKRTEAWCADILRMAKEKILDGEGTICR